jgi:deoxyribonucleoside regulator
MLADDARIERLVKVAEMYYSKNMNQGEIAKELGVSRPLVSVLLSEARRRGVVTITINHAENAKQLLSEQLTKRFGVREIILVEDRKSEAATDDELASAAYSYCFGQCGGLRVGVGWGSLPGRMADYAETLEMKGADGGFIIPLIGGIGASYRGYHTNEITRILSMHSGLRAEYMYLPAIFDSADDLAYARQTEIFRKLERSWDRLDLAVLNISNISSYPDLGAEYRFGINPGKLGAVGRTLAYYYDIHGSLIEPKVNNVVQVSIDQLKNAKKVVACCSVLLQPGSVAGALALGIVNVLILPESLAHKLLES